MQKKRPGKLTGPRTVFYLLIRPNSRAIVCVLLMNSCYKKTRNSEELMGMIRVWGDRFFFAVFFAKINLSPVFEALSLSCLVKLMGTLRFDHPASTDYW